MRYFAKPDTWFDQGTEAVLVTAIWDVNETDQAAIFAGTRNGKPDEEMCGLDEFRIEESPDTTEQGSG